MVRSTSHGIIGIIEAFTTARAIGVGLCPFRGPFLVLPDRIELSTSPLPRERSDSEFSFLHMYLQPPLSCRVSLSCHYLMVVLRPAARRLGAAATSSMSTTSWRRCSGTSCA